MVIHSGSSLSAEFSRRTLDLTLKQGIIYIMIGVFLLIFFITLTKVTLRRINRKKKKNKAEHDLERGQLFRGVIPVRKTRYKSSNRKFARSLLKRWEKYRYLAREGPVGKNASKEYITVTRFLKKQFSFFRRIFSKSSSERSDYWKDTSFRNNITSDYFFDEVNILTKHVLRRLSLLENIEDEPSKKLQKLGLTGLYEYGYFFKKINHDVRAILLSELFLDSIIFDINFEFKQLAKVIERNYILTNTARENLIETLKIAADGISERLNAIKGEFELTIATLNTKEKITPSEIKIGEEDFFSGFKPSITSYFKLKDTFAENLKSLYQKVESAKYDIHNTLVSDAWYSIDQENMVKVFNKNILLTLENLFHSQITSKILEEAENEIIEIMKEAHKVIRRIDEKKQELKKNKKTSVNKEEDKAKIVKYNIVKSYLQKILKELDHKLEKTHGTKYGPKVEKIMQKENKERLAKKSIKDIQTKINNLNNLKNRPDFLNQEFTQRQLSEYRLETFNVLKELEAGLKNKNEDIKTGVENLITENNLEIIRILYEKLFNSEGTSFEAYLGTGAFKTLNDYIKGKKIKI